MAVYSITTTNWNDPSFWATVNETGSGQTLDFWALPSTYSIVYDPEGGALTISDGTTSFVIGDSGYGGTPDATLGGSTQFSYLNIVYGSQGDDSFTGTAGSDTISGGGGNDSIDGGAGDDTLDGGDGNDTISGGDGIDSLHGGLGDDLLKGGAGGDILYGDEGADTILGGDGDDLIYAGEGDDRIVAGAGNDTLYGYTGADTFVVTANSGTNTIEDYNATDGDLIAINYPGITSFTELEPYLSDDGNWGTLISLPDGSVTQVKWLGYATISASNFTFESGPVCFLKGTLIETEAGPRPVETLGPGDLLLTHDNGLQPLRFVSFQTYRFGPGPHRMKPIRLRAGALGPGCPARELLVSPQHRLALPQVDPQVLVAARKLQSLPGVSGRPGCKTACYYHLLMDRHELLRANGAWAETMLVTEYTIRLARIPPEMRLAGMTPVRPLVSGHDSAAAIARALGGPAAGAERGIADGPMAPGGRVVVQAAPAGRA